jgi:4-hydroxybenzoate polyprenyltransferase
MKLAAAFFRLIRFPNLFFIALTQSLFYFCIIRSTYRTWGTTEPMGVINLLLLISASILIAAGGYVINDYFDQNIDRVNKPDRLVVGSIIKRRWAILWHLGLSLAGVALSALVSRKLGHPLPAVFNLVTVILLWFYSTTFKKQLLVGNIIISLLTGWVVLVLYVAISPIGLQVPEGNQMNVLTRVYKFAVLYGGFAFIISLIREVVKDVEDMEGDARYGCRTMPISWGVPVSKMFVTIWLVILIASLVIVQVYALQIRWWFSVLYSVVFIIVPLLMILRKLGPATRPGQFHEISTLTKLVMLTGILSMLFINWYT